MLKNAKPINIILSFLLAIAITLGYQCQRYESINPANLWMYLFFVLIWAGACIISSAIYSSISKSSLISTPSSEELNTPHIWPVSSGIIWILYFIVFLGVYPGFFVYDAQYELTETIARNFSNHQPIFHVLYMGGIIQAVHKLTDNYNIAIAVFTLAQMTFIAIVMGYLIKNLNMTILSKKKAIIFSIYLGLFPVLVMYALCSAKDGVFCAFLMLVFLYLRKLVISPSEFVKNKWHYICFVITAIFMMLMRSNGVHAFLVFTILLVFAIPLLGNFDLCRDSGDRKQDETSNSKLITKDKLILSAKIFMMCLVAIVGYFLSNKVMLTAVNAKDYGSREMLTVPIQQVARVYSYDRAVMTEEEIDTLLRYLPDTALNHYNPKCSDLVKLDFNEEAYAEDSMGFMKLWINLGLKHPVAYINAWAMTSYGMWYPGAIIDGYKGNEVFTFTYGDSSYFGYETELPGIRDSKIPVIDTIYRWLSLDVTIQKIPVIRMLFSPGFMLWIMLYILGYFIYIRDYHKIVPYLLPIIVILTCLLGPISLVRYSYYLWILVPIGVLDCFTTSRN